VIYSEICKVQFYPQALQLALIGFIFFAIACYPGFMSPDSLDQYKQAHSLKFADWHPPVMAWLWSKLNSLLDGPHGLLFLHLGLLWGGVYIWRRYAGENRVANWFVLLGFSPWVANFEGALWKDVGMAFSLLLALGLLRKKKLAGPQVFLSMSLVLYAFMVRANAPAAVAPILWYASWRLFPMLLSWARMAITILSLALMFVFLNFFNYFLLDAEKNHIDSFMMIDDLVHLSAVADKNLLPRADANTVKKCSQEMVGGIKLVGKYFCLKTEPSYRNVAVIPYEEVKEAWLSAVTSNPLECLKFRFNAFFQLLRNPSEKPHMHWCPGIIPNEIGLIQKDNFATILLKVYINGVAYCFPFLFKPYWWLILAMLYLCATFIMQGDKDSLRLIRVLLVSALLYMFSYVPLAATPDFRYVYWSTIATSLAVITYATSNLNFRRDLHNVPTKFRINF
jgi:hypothetical protein